METGERDMIEESLLEIKIKVKDVEREINGERQEVLNQYQTMITEHMTQHQIMVEETMVTIGRMMVIEDKYI